MLSASECARGQAEALQAQLTQDETTDNTAAPAEATADGDDTTEAAAEATDNGDDTKAALEPTVTDGDNAAPAEPVAE